MKSSKFEVLLIFMFLIGVIVVNAESSEPKNAGTGENVADVGAITWTAPSNIVADDTDYATASFTNNGEISTYLQATNYGFSIPAGATINGIQVSIMRQSSSATGGNINDNRVSLIKEGTIIGDNKADGTGWPTSMAEANYGATDNLWGTTWTPADINAANFGVALSAVSTINNDRTASVDYMQITVTYTPDTTAPTISNQPAIEPFDFNYYYISGTVTVSATVDPDLSGINSVSFTMYDYYDEQVPQTCQGVQNEADTSQWSCQIDTTLLSDSSYEGLYDIEIIATDNAGNSATDYYSNWDDYFDIDNTAPSSSDDYFSYDENGTAITKNDAWQNSEQQIILTASDSASGGNIKYCTYTPGFEAETCELSPQDSDTVYIYIGDGGTTILRYTTADFAGNEEGAVKTLVVKIDFNSPVRDSPPTIKPLNDLYYVSGVTNLSAIITDEASGMGSVDFTIGSEGSEQSCSPVEDESSPGLWQCQIDTNSLSDSSGGMYNFRITASDNIGNLITDYYSDWYGHNFDIDNTAPSSSDDYGEKNDTWQSGEQTITLTGSDSEPGSGLANILYCTGTENICEPTTGYNEPVTISDDGITYVRYYSIDNAGNTEETKSLTIKKLGENESVADEEQEIIEEDITEIIVPVGSPLKGVIVNFTDDSKNVNISLAELMNETGEVTLVNDFTLTRDTDTVNYTAEIPAGTVISGGSDWDGKINVPTIKDASDFSAPSGSVDIVIDVGSSIEINFSNAVKIVIGGKAGKNAGWARGTNTLTEITTLCNSATNPTNINEVSPRECYINSGSDLLVWTYHFTEFAAYTPAAAQSGNVVTRSGGSRSITPTPKTPTPAVTTPVTTPAETTETKEATPAEAAEAAEVVSSPAGAVIGTAARTGISGFIVIIAVGGLLIFAHINGGMPGSDNFTRAANFHRRAEKQYKSGNNEKASWLYLKANELRKATHFKVRMIQNAR